MNEGGLGRHAAAIVGEVAEKIEKFLPARIAPILNGLTKETNCGSETEFTEEAKEFLPKVIANVIREKSKSRTCSNERRVGREHVTSCEHLGMTPAFHQLI